MRMGTSEVGRSTQRDYAALGVEWTSGPGSAVTGIFYSLPGGDVAFLGQLLPRSCSAPGAAAELERRWNRPGSVGRLTGRQGLRPGSS
jgi:hypothetical protein